MKLLKRSKDGPEEEISGSETDAPTTHFSINPEMLESTPSMSNVTNPTPTIQLIASEENDFPTSLQNIPHAKEVWADAYGKYCLSEAIKDGKTDNALKKMCLAYHQKLASDIAKASNLYLQLSKQRAEQAYKDKQKNYTHLSVLPPTEFSDVHKISNGTLKRKDVQSWMPRHEFSGSDHPRSQRIENFLTQMTKAQEKFNLSQDEFLHMLEANVTGVAAENVSNWVNQRYSPGEIYEKLLSLYGTYLKPDVALTKLLSFQLPKDAKNLTQVVRQIELLAGHAANTTTSDKLRQKNRNAYSVQALQRCLPPHSKVLLQDKLNDLRAELEAIKKIKLRDGDTLTAEEEDLQPSFTSLVRALTALNPVVDDEICEYNERKLREERFRPKSVNVTTRAKSYEKSTSQFYRNNTRDTNRGDSRPTQPTTYTPKRNQHIYEIRDRGESNNKQNNYTKPNNYNNKSSYQLGNGKTRCSLCGAYNHLASQLCKAITDDEGKILKPTFSYAFCEHCKKNYDEQLNHPHANCPARPAMIKLYESGKVRPQGIYYNIFKHLIPGNNSQQYSSKHMQHNKQNPQ